MIPIELVLIAAVAQNRVIGVNNQLPWHLPEDLKHFRDLTRGHAVLMGRKTWESLPAAFRPLPGRRNLVLSRQPDLVTQPAFQGAECFGSLEQALQVLSAQEVARLFVIGGAEIYQQAIQSAHCLEITEVAVSPAGDAWFPEIDPAVWEAVSRETYPAATGSNTPGYAFVRYQRCLS